MVVLCVGRLEVLGEEVVVVGEVWDVVEDVLLEEVVGVDEVVSVSLGEVVEVGPPVSDESPVVVPPPPPSPPLVELVVVGEAVPGVLPFPPPLPLPLPPPPEGSARIKCASKFCQPSSATQDAAHVVELEGMSAKEGEERKEQ